MSKREPILIALGECPDKWNEFLLKTYGLPQEPATRTEIQQDCLPRKQNGQRWTLDEAGDSITQQTDPLLSLHQEAAANDIVLPPDWQRYVDFMGVFAESFPADRRDAVRRLALETARSRHWESATDIPAVLGTMVELRARWERGEIWFRAQRTRGDWTIFVEYDPPGMSPDEPEELDEAGEPSGCWDGLKWTPNGPESL